MGNSYNISVRDGEAPAGVKRRVTSRARYVKTSSLLVQVKRELGEQGPWKFERSCALRGPNGPSASHLSSSLARDRGRLAPLKTSHLAHRILNSLVSHSYARCPSLVLTLSPGE